MELLMGFELSSFGGGGPPPLSTFSFLSFSGLMRLERV